MNLVRLSEALIRRGHQVTVVSSGGELVPALHATGARHFQSPVNWRAAGGLIAAALRLRSLVAHESFAVVHVLSASANLAMYPSRSRQRSWLYLTSPMGLQNSDQEPPLVTRLRIVLLASGADQILSVSPAIETALLERGVLRSRIIPCDLVGLEDRFFGAAGQSRESERARLGFGGSDLVVTTIGALHPRKSHDKFIEMAAMVVREHPEARFLVVGDGPYRGRLEGQARALGIAGRVRFPGQLLDVRGVLEATDVYVRPGVVEGFIGITVLEAMAMSRPVVAFDTRDVRMVVEDGATGLLARNADAHDLASKVARLLADEDQRRRLGSSGRDVVDPRFRIGRVAAGLENLYARLAADRLSAGRGDNRL